jgi:hypothetical protein
VVAGYYDCDRCVEGDVGISQNAAYIIQFRLVGGRDPVRHGAAVHFLCALAEGKVDLSLIGGDAVGHVLFSFFNECTEAFGGVDMEGSILT